MASLAELAAQSEHGIDLSPKKNNSAPVEKREYVSPFASGEVLPIEISDTKVTTTKNGYFQMSFARAVIREDGSTMKAGRVFNINLPVFSDEVKAKTSSEKLASLEQMWGEQLHKLLSAVEPETFQVYKSSNKNGKVWSFTLHNGDVIDAATKAERASLVGRAVLAAAQQLVDGTRTLDGSRCYMQEVPNKVEGKDPYKNFYSEKRETSNG